MIQQILGQIMLPYLKSISGIVTIRKVETSRDLRWAKVWITIVDADDEATLNYLKNNIYDIQGELNRAVEMKIVPRISFHLDTTARYAQHIDEVFKRITEEQKDDER